MSRGKWKHQGEQAVAGFLIVVQVGPDLSVSKRGAQDTEHEAAHLAYCQGQAGAPTLLAFAQTPVWVRVWLLGALTFRWGSNVQPEAVKSSIQFRREVEHLHIRKGQA